jgi:hypothetical protein
MGSVGDMRTVRAVLLAIVATLALAGGFASTADAGGGPHRSALTYVGGSGGSYGQLDPGDPGLPPDP